MLEMLYGFAALVFTWAALGIFVILPAGLFVGWIVQSYIKYATKGEIKTSNPFNVLFEKWIYSEHGEMAWAENKGIDILIMFVMSIINFMGTGASLVMVNQYDYSWPDALTAVFFTPAMYVGEFIAPLVLLFIVVMTPTYLSRKMFDLKNSLVNHMKDKEAHR